MEESGAYRAGDDVAGKYRLTRVLGIGGMGCVWRARNETLQVDVALKLIHAALTSPEAAQRLLQEARAAARIGHPSIVRVIDFGETDKKDPFLVMELLDGESLFSLFDRKKKLSPQRAVRTLLPVASALAAAHERGIVHRDLKPDNIVLVPQHGGAIVPKVVDFGIAKLFEDGSPRSLRAPKSAPPISAPSSDRVTREGDILGSPAYMSPEQARGTLEVDARTDVWALCVMLYEAIVGEPPFTGPTDDAILGAIMLDDPVPPNGRDVDDFGLWPILARGLEKDPAARQPTMRALGRELAGWARAHGVETDVAGTSIASHWLGEHKITETPASEARKLAELDHAGLEELAKASSKPKPEVETTDPERASPVTSIPARGGSKVWLFVAVGLAALVLFLLLR